MTWKQRLATLVIATILTMLGLTKVAEAETTYVPWRPEPGFQTGGAALVGTIGIPEQGTYFKAVYLGLDPDGWGLWIFQYYTPTNPQGMHSSFVFVDDRRFDIRPYGVSPVDPTQNRPLPSEDRSNTFRRYYGDEHNQKKVEDFLNDSPLVPRSPAPPTLPNPVVRVPWWRLGDNAHTPLSSSPAKADVIGS